MDPQVDRQRKIWVWKWVLLGSVALGLLWGIAQLGLARQFFAVGPLAAFAPNPQPKANPEKEPAQTSHPLIRALLEALDAFHGEGADTKDALRDRLQKADKQLQPLLTGRKEKILQANRKVVLPLIEESSGPQAGSAKKEGAASGKPSAPSASEPSSPPDAEKPTDKKEAEPKPSTSARKPPPKPLSPSPSSAQETKSAAQASQRDEVQTAIVRALLDALDKIDNVSEEDKREVRKLLLEADQDLVKALEPRSVKPPRGRP